MRSVLVALRDHDIRESMQRELEDAGYITYTAGKATTSLMVLHMCPEQLIVLLDARLPAEGAAERMLLRRGHSSSLARHQYVLCADVALERISPSLKQLALAQGLPVLRMPFVERELHETLRHGAFPSASTRVSGGPA
jgi:DNA-binding NtrC family response regulator